MTAGGTDPSDTSPPMGQRLTLDQLLSTSLDQVDVPERAVPSPPRPPRRPDAGPAGQPEPGPGPVAPAPPPSPAPGFRQQVRAGQRRARQVRRNRRVIGLVALVGVGLIADLAGLGPPVVGRVSHLLPSRGAEPAPSPASTLLAVPTSGDDGAVIVLLGAVPGAGRASALLLPAHLQVEVPSFGSRTLADTLQEVGPASLALAVENAIGVDVQSVEAFDRASLAGLLGPARHFEVRLRQPVTIGGVAYGAGPRTVGTAEAVRMLTTPTGTDLDHLVVVHAVLEGWLRGLRGERLDRAAAVVSARAGAGRNAAMSALRTAARGEVRFDTLGVKSVSLPESERYTIDEGAADDAIPRAFPGLTLGAGSLRPRIEILNGTGTPGLTEAVARILVPRGYRVMLTGNAAHFGAERTTVILHDPQARPAAERVVDLLRTGELRRARDPVSVVDISVVVGGDFAPPGVE